MSREVVDNDIKETRLFNMNERGEIVPQAENAHPIYAVLDIPFLSTRVDFLYLKPEEAENPEGNLYVKGGLAKEPDPILPVLIGKDSLGDSAEFALLNLLPRIFGEAGGNPESKEVQYILELAGNKSMLVINGHAGGDEYVIGEVWDAFVKVVDLLKNLPQTMQSIYNEFNREFARAFKEKYGLICVVGCNPEKVRLLQSVADMLGVAIAYPIGTANELSQIYGESTYEFIYPTNV